MFDPGPRYRRTRYGWEPLGAFPPAHPIPATGTEAAIAYIQELTDLGIPPKRAVKYWGYIRAALRERAETRS